MSKGVQISNISFASVFYSFEICKKLKSPVLILYKILNLFELTEHLVIYLH